MTGVFIDTSQPWSVKAENKDVGSTSLHALSLKQAMWLDFFRSSNGLWFN